MNKLTFFLLCALLALAIPVLSLAQSPESGEYTRLLSKLRSGDFSIDFAALRKAFTRTPGYQPNNLVLAGQSREMFAAIEGGRFEEATSVAEEILAKNYTHSEAHIGAAMAYQQLGNADLSRYHAAVSRGLFDSICGGTGGRTPDTPCVVISVEEEHFFLAASGYTLHERMEARCTTGPCDAMKVTSQSGDPITFYFDVSIPISHQEAQKTD